LTGLNGSSADISATSNNIANVGTTGFKRSRAEFGDIFATSPLQNASSSIGSGAILKGIKQQFTQGNISSSLNALDLAISGQGFFTLKPSLTSAQKVYTRNGSLNVDNDRYVVDSAGQYLLVYPVNDDGSVTAKDLDSALPLQLPVTSGDPQATSNISLGVNVPAAADVVPDRAAFSDGYTFNPADPNTFMIWVTQPLRQCILLRRSQPQRKIQQTNTIHDWLSTILSLILTLFPPLMTQAIRYLSIVLACRLRKFRMTTTSSRVKAQLFTKKMPSKHWLTPNQQN
jgi:flagellar hook protein FlgE